MMPVLNNANRNIFLIGLLAQLVAAWFSIGFLHFDEHFQVLEFCNYKLGLSQASALPWEFATQCRPALQPLVAWALARILMLSGLYNPFALAFLLRLLMGVLTWYITCRVLQLMLPNLVTERGKRLYILASFFLWFVPYCGVRFSAENVSGLLFFLSLIVILELQQNRETHRSLRLMIAGLLLGLVFMLRLQMSLAFIGMGAWLLFYGKWSLPDWLKVFLSSLAGIGIGVLADRWFYGVWVFTPFNYYKVNVIQNVAAHFGVFPWWYYFDLFLQNVVPPISIALLPLFFVGVWHRPRHLFTWVSIAFIAGHCLIGHKEMRFLIPMTYAFIYLSFSGLDWLIAQFPDRWFFRWPVKLLVVINCIVLVIKMLMPAHESVPYCQFIYAYARQQPVIVVGNETSPYHFADLNANFYKPHGLQEFIIHDTDGLAVVMRNAHGSSVLFVNPQMEPIPLIARHKKTKLYCLFPDWLKWLNFNDWESRSFIWTIYRLE